MQPSHLLRLAVEPALFEYICLFLDPRSVASLELCCTAMRDLVLQTRIYRRKYKIVSRIQQVQWQEDRLLDRCSRHTTVDTAGWLDSSNMSEILTKKLKYRF